MDGKKYKLPVMPGVKTKKIKIMRCVRHPSIRKFGVRALLTTIDSGGSATGGMDIMHVDYKRVAKKHKKSKLASKTPLAKYKRTLKLFKKPSFIKMFSEDLQPGFKGASFKNHL